MGLAVPSRSRGQAGAPGAAGPAGRGVSHTDVVGGNLIVTYTDGSTVNAGHVLGADGTAGAAGRGIAAVEIVGGHLRLTFSDNAVQNLGQVVGATGATGATGAAGRGVTSSSISGGRLILTFTDGTSQDLGQVTGPTGATGSAGTNGRGVASTAISGGHLILTFTDGTTQDVGQVVGAAGSANLSTFRRVYVSSVEITGSNSNYNFAGVVPTGATEVEVECVPGGASGFSGRTDGSLPGHGGEAGTPKRVCKPVVQIPSNLAVTIGPGGAASTPSASVCTSNPGGSTSFGSILSADGAKGGSYSSLGDLGPLELGQPGCPPVGRAGRLNGLPYNPGGSGSHLDAQPSMGPGSGGAGLMNTTFNTQNFAGAGGDGGMHLPNSRTYGGSGRAAITTGQPGDNGQNARDVFGYGSGGGGSSGINWGGGGGGLPGGGGGGGGCIPSGSGGSVGGSAGGPGARGAIRLHFYKYEAP
ncbi:MULTISPECIES: hypothetical protein [Methylobacterium]|uniref:glycine-rich domain-containing protein n=1 Tax=Methylobacterium TaxID=407 RepID=UPI00272E53D0|nr:hypothetical protein [Methylobacterium sp.]